jgi:hypothetical protein
MVSAVCLYVPSYALFRTGRAGGAGGVRLLPGASFAYVVPFTS